MRCYFLCRQVMDEGVQHHQCKACSARRLEAGTRDERVAKTKHKPSYVMYADGSECFGGRGKLLG